MTPDKQGQLELAYLRLQKGCLIELAELVVETLAAQKTYFHSRSREALVASKQLEKRLGDRATEILKAK